jgi:hypothetical protein
MPLACERHRRTPMTALMLALLASIAIAVPGAEATFEGVVRGDLPLTLELTPSVGTSAVTVLYMKMGARKGKLKGAELLTATYDPVEHVTTHTLESLKGVDRLVLMVDVAKNSTMRVTVLQDGAAVLSDVMGQDGSLVLDVSTP